MRLNNWMNPYEELIGNETNLSNPRTAYEAGADAMLKALKEYGAEYNDQVLEYLVYPNPKVKGWLVFIEEEIK